MRNTVIAICGAVLLGTLQISCVSKKKYDALSRDKWNADREILNLREANASLSAQMKRNEEEFNAIRYDMAASNAEKDKDIYSLTVKLKEAEKRSSELQTELENTTDRMLSSNTTSGELLKELQAKLTQVSGERRQLERDINNLEFENRELNSRIEQLNRNLAGKDSDIEKQKNEYSALSKKLSSLQQNINELKDENEKYKNQVNLLRKQLGL